jgi:serine/threonine protein kinase
MKKKAVSAEECSSHLAAFAKKYKKGKLLGKGNFGEVFECKLLSSTEDYMSFALKILNKEDFKDDYC